MLHEMLRGRDVKRLRGWCNAMVGIATFLLLLWAASPASAGIITGQVSSSSETGIAGIWVYASDAVSCLGYSCTTQSDGSYTIAGLPTGSYKVQFYGNGTGYVTQWYSNKTSRELADSVSVTAGATTSGINATLVMGGAITGRVTGLGEAGIAGVSVYALGAAGEYGYGYTQSDGSYTIAGLAPGSYKVQFEGYGTGYLSEWYNNKTTQDAADTISVTSANVTAGINAILTLGGSIEGRVTDTNGAPDRIGKNYCI